MAISTRLCGQMQADMRLFPIIFVNITDDSLPIFTITYVTITDNSLPISTIISSMNTKKTALN